MKKFLPVTLLCFSISLVNCFGQLSESWYQCEYGYDNICCGYFGDLIQLSDGNFLVCGSEPATGGSLLIKFDKNGSIIWRDTFVIQNQVPAPNLLQEDEDGNIFFTQTNIPFSRILKLDANGHKIWSKTIIQNIVLVMQVDAQKNIILVAGDPLPTEKLYIVKLDSVGDTLWSKIIDSTFWYPGISYVKYKNGSFIISYLNGTLGNLVQKYDGNGGLVWSFAQPYLGVLYDDNQSGNFFLYETPNSSLQIKLDKYDSLGILTWSKPFNDTLSIISDLVVAATGDVFFITTGIPQPAAPFDSFRLYKLDAEGNTEWKSTYKDTANPKIDVWEMVSTVSGKVFVAGRKASPYNIGYTNQVFLASFDTNGNFLSEATHYETDSFVYNINPLRLISDSFENIIVGGELWSVPDNAFFTLNFFNQDFPTLIEQCQGKMISTLVFPNPFSYSATLQLRTQPTSETSYRLLIFDVLGNQIRSSDFYATTFTMERDNLPEGIYFYQVQDRNGIIGIGKFSVAD